MLYFLGVLSVLSKLLFVLDGNCFTLSWYNAFRSMFKIMPFRGTYCLEQDVCVYLPRLKEMWAWSSTIGPRVHLVDFNEGVKYMLQSLSLKSMGLKSAWLLLDVPTEGFYMCLQFYLNETVTSIYINRKVTSVCKVYCWMFWGILN